MTATLGETVRTNASDETVSETVIEAVADAKGVDPLDLDPIYEAVDPDALDSIFRAADEPGASPVELSFTVARCEVVVRGSGEVVVRPSPSTDEAADRIPSAE